MSDPLNLNHWEERYKGLKDDMKKLLKMVLKHLPREDIIKELKRRKIIIRDWGQDGEVYNPLIES